MIQERIIKLTQALQSESVKLYMFLISIAQALISR